MSIINTNPVPDMSSCSGENCCYGEKLSGYTNCGGFYYQCMYMTSTNSVNCSGIDGTDTVGQICNT